MRRISLGVLLVLLAVLPVLHRPFLRSGSGRWTCSERTFASTSKRAVRGSIKPSPDLSSKGGPERHTPVPAKPRSQEK
jgi:hypothetical protein